MACTDCTPIQIPAYIGNVSTTSTQYCSTSPCGSNSSDSNCVVYTGPNLSCTGVYTGNTVQAIIQKFNETLCATTGNYSVYNTYCLAPIFTQQGFVEGISQYVCNFKSVYDTFIGTTNPAYQASVVTRFEAIEKPATTSCSYLGIASGDTIQQIIQKQSNKICDLDARLNLSSVVWNNCFTVSPAPTTIPQAFTIINSEICSLKADIASGGSGTLPTFNNVGSCLPTPLTSTDSLSSTVNKIKTRLCTTPVFDINALTWTCTTKPSSSTTDLQGAFQAVLTKLDTISQNFPIFSGDFAVTNVDDTQSCAGKRVALAISSVADRFVAVNTSDSTPGTLASKIIAGSGVSIDVTTTPGTMILNSTASGANDKVKSRSADATADFLENKITGGATTTGVTITTSTNTSSNKVEIGVGVNKSALFTALLNQLSTDTDLKTLFCEFVQSCLPDCQLPPTIITTVNPQTSSTTTTTTTLSV